MVCVKWQLFFAKKTIFVRNSSLHTAIFSVKPTSKAQILGFIAKHNLICDKVETKLIYLLKVY